VSASALMCSACGVLHAVQPQRHPDSVRDTFITRAGGTAEARAQTAYLFPSLGGITLLLIIVAMGIVLIGTLPRQLLGTSVPLALAGR
jgi:hypothetical protein